MTASQHDDGSRATVGQLEWKSIATLGMQNTLLGVMVPTAWGKSGPEAKAPASDRCGAALFGALPFCYFPSGGSQSYGAGFLVPGESRLQIGLKSKHFFSSSSFALHPSCISLLQPSLSTSSSEVHNVSLFCTAPCAR